MLCTETSLEELVCEREKMKGKGQGSEGAGRNEHLIE